MRGGGGERERERERERCMDRVGNIVYIVAWHSCGYTHK